MDTENIFLELKKIIPEENILKNESMKKHTTFKTGGIADLFVKVKSIDQLKDILFFCKNNDVKFYVIGNGSNLIVSDKGLRGIAIKIELKDIEIKDINGEKEIVVESGVMMGFLAQKLLKQQITGFEELSGIPGTVGGAVVMNAGAHGKEMKDIITEITAVDYNGNIYNFSNEDALFDYRKSRFQNEDYIIVKIKMLLDEGKEDEIKKKMDEFLQYRKEKQPIEYPNAGSTFKRGNDFITAQLIDQAGLKGYSIGDAQVSDKHAGFIINKGNATSDEILSLVKYVEKIIFEKFDKKIKLENIVLGESFKDK